jgi:hypothetical protein
MRSNLVGKTVALTLCKAWDVRGNQTEISGLWEVEDWDCIERGGPFFILYDPSGPDSEENSVTVDEYDLIEQVDPHAYGRILEQERMMDFMEESND